MNTVGEIVEKIREIDRLTTMFDHDELNSSYLEDLIDLIIEYKDELLKKEIKWGKLMKDVLVVKTESMLHPDILHKFQLDFAEQLKSGVVIIPPYFDAELINVPDDVEVMVQAK